MDRTHTVNLTYIALCTSMISICSWISIPAAVPFTMQTFGVFLAVGLLGGRRGTEAVALYLLLGAAGLPVFSGFSGGIGYMMGATGGYIIGFLFTAITMWMIEKAAGSSYKVLALSMAAGLAVCYAFGTAWFMAVYTKNTGDIGIAAALGWCVLPYIIPDVIKICLALIICRRLRPAISIRP